MTSPFKLIDLPSGSWAVTWSTQHWVLDGQETMDIIFDEMKQCQAKLGVLVNNGGLDLVRIDLTEYYHKSLDIQNFVSQYVIGGASFDTEAQAREFLQFAEKYHIMNLLKESA